MHIIDSKSKVRILTEIMPQMAMNDLVNFIQRAVKRNKQNQISIWI